MDERRDYTKSTLSRAELHADPLQQWAQWLNEARAAGIADATAACLATADGAGFPNARTVLLRGEPTEDPTFFTHYGSAKARELAANPSAALLVFWPQLERQVRFRGTVTTTTAAESDAYFESRPTSSRIGAWASPQSQPIADRTALEKLVTKHTDRHAGDNIPRPGYWGGFRLRPLEIEFWQGRASRLHDRFLYLREDNAWSVRRLAP